MHNGEKIYTLRVCHFFARRLIYMHVDGRGCTSVRESFSEGRSSVFAEALCCSFSSKPQKFIRNLFVSIPHLFYDIYRIFFVVFPLFSMRQFSCVLPKKQQHKYQNFIPSFYSVTSVLLVICSDSTRLVPAGNQLPGFVCSVCVVLPGSGQTAEAPPLAGPPPLMWVTVRGGD